MKVEDRVRDIQREMLAVHLGEKSVNDAMTSVQVHIKEIYEEANPRYICTHKEEMWCERPLEDTPRAERDVLEDGE